MKLEHPSIIPGLTAKLSEYMGRVIVELNKLCELGFSATYDPPSLADGAGATTTVAAIGANVGDFAIASFSADLQGITVTAYVSAANVVTVRFQNESGGVIDLASGTLRVRVIRQ